MVRASAAMEPSAVIETARLALRPPHEADLEGWAALDADPRSMRFFGGPRSRAGSWEGLATAVGMWALRGASLFTVSLKDSGRFVGRVGPWIPEGALGPEIGWALLSSEWGQGYATEAAAGAIDWAFETLGWREVIHCIDPGNAASFAVAARLGSSFLRRDVEADGKLVEVWGQTAETWWTGRRASR